MGEVKGVQLYNPHASKITGSEQQNFHYLDPPPVTRLFIDHQLFICMSTFLEVCRMVS